MAAWVFYKETIIMAYSDRQHAHLVQRVANFCRGLRQHQIEAVAINELFQVLAESGQAGAYSDTVEATASEVTAGVELSGELLAFLTGDPVSQKDRRPTTTAFLQE